MTTATPGRATSVPTGTWKSDLVHSTIGFSARHMVVSTFRGELPEFDVTLADGELVGSAPVSSIVTKDPNLTAHLGSPDFFDAERHPEVLFRSTSMRITDGELVVEGELTIKGITKPIRLHGAVSGPHPDPYGMERIGIHLEGAFDRRDFSIQWQAEIPGGGLALGYEVAVAAEIELIRQG